MGRLDDDFTVLLVILGNKKTPIPVRANITYNHIC
jgi:hypothetical protein